MKLETDWHTCKFRVETIFDKKLLNELYKSLKDTWESNHDSIQVEKDDLHNIIELAITTYE